MEEKSKKKKVEVTQPEAQEIPRAVLPDSILTIDVDSQIGRASCRERV